jgi:hypothetical protein
MDRISQNDFIESCATHFRNTAASKRTVPLMTFTVPLQESVFLSTLSSCSGQTWAAVETSSLVTHVMWSTHDADIPHRAHDKAQDAVEASGADIAAVAHDAVEAASADLTNLNDSSDVTGFTIISGHSKSSFWLDNYAHENNSKINCKIFALRSIEPSDMQFAVETREVIMRQQTSFTKGPFKLILARQWTGKTNVEAEASLLKDRGKTFAILETVDPESILMNRCSDAQLANAIWTRLPK